MVTRSGRPSAFISATQTEIGMGVSPIVPLEVRTGTCPRSPVRFPAVETPCQVFSRREAVSKPPLNTMFLGAGVGAWAGKLELTQGTRKAAAKTEQMRMIVFRYRQTRGK